LKIPQDYKVAEFVTPVGPNYRSQGRLIFGLWEVLLCRKAGPKLIGPFGVTNNPLRYSWTYLTCRGLVLNWIF